MPLRSVLISVLTLLLVGLGMAANARSADASSEASSAARADGPRTYDEALEHFRDADGRTLKIRRFETPSGNIYCAIKARKMPVKGCEIYKGAVEDPAACESPPGSPTVGRIEFCNHRATPVCNTDTIRQPGARTLPYGSKARYPRAGVKCLSESIGVTCISLKKTEGFFLRRGEYVIFNAG